MTLKGRYLLHQLRFLASNYLILYYDSMSEYPKIALVHDEFTRRGGAEIVFEELLRLFPSADVYALYASNKPYIILEDHSYRIHTSYIQRLPLWFRRHPGRVLPLLPQSAEQLELSAYDLVISSSSGFAKGVVTRSGIPHLCYCHTPTRYIWDATYEVIERAPKGSGLLLRLILHYLLIADFAAAQRPDMYIANSRYTKQRIRTYYRRDSEVIYPPVDTSFYYPNTNREKTKNNFLIVARLTPAKYIDHAIEVCEKLHFHLTVVGTGQDSRRLKKKAGRYTQFLGHVPNQQLRDLYRSSRAFIQPGIEDFGIASVEALSCGTPIIAFGKGGILEIADRNAYGVLYQEQKPEILADAIRQFITREDQFIPEKLQKKAMKFSRSRFTIEMKKKIDDILHRYKTIPTVR